MTMTTDPVRYEVDDAGLDARFAAARAAEPPVPDRLVARVLADAAAHVPKAIPRPAASRTLAGGWLAGLLDMLGGRGAVAGLAAAGLAGVWIGFVQPVGLSLPLTAAAGGTEAIDLYPAELEQWADVVAPETVPEG